MTCPRCKSKMAHVDTVKERRGDTKKFLCGCKAIAFDDGRATEDYQPLEDTMRGLAAKACLPA
jgi:hypothetical protein